MARNIHKKFARIRSALSRSKSGYTMVELLATVSILSLMAGAIYMAGFTVLRHAQSVTIATAAHAYAKEGLEEMIAAGYETLQGGEAVEQVIMMNPNTHNVDLVRETDFIWHKVNGATSETPVADGYVEVVVRVTWDVPRSTATGSTAVSTLIF